jgi:hypothetical protein
MESDDRLDQAERSARKVPETLGIMIGGFLVVVVVVVLLIWAL